MRSAIVGVLAASTIVAPLLGTVCMDPAHAHPGETRQGVPATTPEASAPAEPGLPSPLYATDDPTADAAAPTRSEEQAARTAEREPIEEPLDVEEPLEKVVPDLELLAEERATAAAEPPPPTFVMPLGQNTFRVSSSYGGRTDPFNGAAAFHEGVDLAAPMDTPIYAVADGVVDYVGPGKDGRSSMIIVIAHDVAGQRFYSWYNHMYADDLYVQEGQSVSAGEVIAGVGSNGRSTGPHLHFEIHTDDALTTTDPLAWLGEREAVDISALS
ncbi:Murein DD-endopeptidase MepM and murein hydrolase activator NlpD, contain LysM domain [Georgenia satyanarayanai]|uniref:Murein DD-endopeptidase MepM and murein hydrolase activator NlpD, contain LysM domain n=1 Tax=Georgenia satyanarayanai TaxID=860221 RepID=A0A2Y9C7V3_9MICO|nr:M23 family metallopeptidase [Georgenia satyanarayanai]PYF96359.1 murein DD-endopeptidase MepM/ murein hydrolase activator NlpD [Georgenia satyanarayanai]SSA46893.1 Murein DD-endopeptidase MepM and murein hydrolase activator NlpD, contain LysM domain [Georgenia satyanarayanai]